MSVKTDDKQTISNPEPTPNPDNIDRHPSIEHVLQFFEFEHLPEHLKNVSRDFAYLALKTAEIGNNAETTVALRKLLEAKDAAVRSAKLEHDKQQDGRR